MLDGLGKFVEGDGLSVVHVKVAEASLEIYETLTDFLTDQRKQFLQMLFVFCLLRLLAANIQSFSSIVLGSTLVAVHDVGELIGVVFIAQFVDLDRVVVEKVDELRQKLNSNGPLGLCCLGICLLQNLVILLVVVDRDNRNKHFVHLVSAFLPFKKSKEHFAEGFNSHQTPFVFNHLVELLSQVI